MQLLTLLTVLATTLTLTTSTPVPQDFSDATPIPTHAHCPAPKTCPKSFAPTPVCGSNGKTYNSNCDLLQSMCSDRSKTLRYQYKGECHAEDFKACPDVCPDLFVADPVCGSNGQTYTSDCHLRKAACGDKSIKMVSRGECAAVKTVTIECPAPNPCPAYFVDASICAFDGQNYQTYSSPCELQTAQCNQKSKFSHAYDGHCKN
ncbi:hypothetical protein HDU97_005407 [Phlyctochytrium planicorne]|nr:hypothetical protein HDU97_005407 [Phlyctochytrium planicorne]